MGGHDERLREALQTIITAYDEWANGPADFGSHRVDLAVESARSLLAAQPQETAPAAFDGRAEAELLESLGRGQLELASKLCECQRQLKLARAVPATAQWNECGGGAEGMSYHYQRCDSMNGNYRCQLEKGHSNPHCNPMCSDWAVEPSAMTASTRAQAEQLTQALARITSRLDAADIRLINNFIEAHGLRQRLEQHRLDCRIQPDQCRMHADLECQLKEAEGK